eukprot:GILI01010035.1.p1 GENE.GILI01010035.1~~GILI01010035.1.p1  ORF type:complete len:1026 (-),score=267.21 GILI01010035.1:155-3232(-)
MADQQQAQAPPAGEKKKKLLNGTNIEYKYPSGSVYVGGFKDGKLHGFGRYKYHPSGDIYEGEWLSDMKHGHGIYTYDGGDRYTGEWRAGKKHGKGTYTFASGDEYVGAWADDKIHGFGVFLIARNGNRYEGNWEESYRQGHGVLTSGNGDVYDGLWVRGKEEGLGVFTYANGNVYVGDWRAGAMDGKGILVERGQKQTVEHIAGYLIAKVPIDEDTAPEEGWQNADRLYRNYRKKLQKEAADKANAGTGEKVDGQAIVKAQMETNMWKRRYEELLAQKTEDLLSGEPTDVAGLQRRVVALKVQQESERNRADIAVSQVKLLESEMDQVRQQLKQAELNGGGGGGGAGSADEAESERLRQKVAELTKELDLRKKAGAGASPTGAAAAGTGSTIDTNDPVELKVRLELAEGELRNLREKREEVYKLREQNMDGMKTIQRLETRNEELLKEINVHRARSTNLQGQINENASRQYQELASELTELKRVADEALKAKADAEATASKARKGEQFANTRVTDLEAENARLKTRNINADSDLGKNLDKKMDQLDSLRKQNADLQRQVDELQYDLSKASKSGKKKDKGGDDFAHEATGAAVSAEVESLQADLKKEKKKYKKAVGERDAIAQELYNEQLLTTRLSRAMDTLRGRVAVLAAIDNHTDLENNNTLLRINQENPAEIFVYDKGAPAAGESASPDAADDDTGGKKKKKKDKGSSSAAVEFDACVDSAHTHEDLYDEIKMPLQFTAEGFHTALVTVGPMGSGKSYLLTALAPKIFKGLFESTQKNQAKANSTFATVVKVGALEVAHNGIFDLVSGSEIMSVSRSTSSLDVVAVGETFTEVKDEKDAMKLFDEYRKKRRITSGRSHFIFHTIVEMRHRVQHFVKTGKFTIVDLCGQGSLADQEKDAESARFVNSSAKSLSAVLEDLAKTADATSSPAIPYGTNNFSMLLADLFGGNCITTVLACASATNKDTITENAATLRMASQLREVFNRPVIQNHQTPDVHRLRGLVADAVDRDQSVPALQEISNFRM